MWEAEKKITECICCGCSVLWRQPRWVNSPPCTWWRGGSGGTTTESTRREGSQRSTTRRWENPTRTASYGSYLIFVVSFKQTMLWVFDIKIEKCLKKVTQTPSVVSVTNMRSAPVPLHRQEFPPNLDDRAGEQCSLRQGLLQEQLESRGRPRVGLAACGGRE